jgi:hypothetical protein
MERMAKILIVAGLLLLLCAPALAAAQADRPVKAVPCTSASPVIDGNIEPLWEQYAHLEDITVDFEVVDLQKNSYHPYGVYLAMMHDPEKLYILVAEYWEEADLEIAQESDLHSIFCMAFEDQAPAWEWNVKNPANDSGEGWLCFVGGEGFDVDDASAQEWMGLESVAFFIGRIGGEQESLLDCFDGLWVNPEGMLPDVPKLTGVKHAFAAYYEGELGPEHLMWVHEVAMDLSKSPLSPVPEDTFRAWFGTFALGPAEIGAAELHSEQGLRALAETIGQQLPEDFLVGLWPGGRGMADPADDPGEQMEDLLEFVFCCEEFGEFDESCDWCLPCFGEIELAPCDEEEAEEVVEFVPEPATLLLLGSGLVGVGGYFGLRRKTRE